jgi:hypothetical protein
MTQFLPGNMEAKSFWARPEGTLGMIVAAVLAALSVYGISLILPWLISLFTNILTAAALFVAVAIVLTILTSKRFWTLFFGTFKLIMRGVTNVFITIDPIGILKNYVDSLREKLGNIDRQIQSLRGQMGQLKVTIDRNRADMEKSIGLAKQARDKNKVMALTLNARAAGRLRDSNITLDQLYKKLEGLMRVLNKMREVSEFYLQDIAQNVDTMERQKRAIDTGYSAMRSALAFVRNSSDDKVIYDMTVEYLLNDYGQKLGEIDHFMEVAAPFIESVDLQNMSFEEDALRGLEQWEKKADALILGDTNAKLLLGSGNDLSDLLGDAPQKVQVPVATQTNSSSKFLKR